MTDTVFTSRPPMDFIVERSGGEIVRDSLRIYRDHFGALAVIYALPLLPVAALSVYAVAAGDAGAGIAAGLLQMVVAVFPTGAVTVAVSDICLGLRPSLRSAYRIMLANLWRYLATYLLLMLAFMLGLLLLVVPGVVVLVWYMFACQVCVIERRGPIQSMRRSRLLVRGSFWRCLGVWLALLLIMILAMFAAMMLIVLVYAYAFPSWYSMDDTAAIDEVAAWAITFGFMPFMITGIVLLYYDLRVRKENYDSASLMDELLH